MKTLFYRLEHGSDWEPYQRKNGRWVHIHNVYPTRPFAEASEGASAENWSFTIVRDPVLRLQSCYKNRVRTGPGRQKLERERDNLEALGLSVEPSFDEFVDNLTEYQDFEVDIKWHSDRLSFFLGQDAGFYDRVFDMSQLADCYAALQERVGTLPKLQHLQRRGQNIEIGKASKQTIKKIKDVYAEDYEIFGRYFPTASTD